MYFVGIDLAWGERNPSGVAVLDSDGRLVHVSAQSTDETIVAALEPFRDEPALVAIDAPLVVTNATGNRPCEAALNRDFGRFDAGAHPANTGKPEFAGAPRGARVAKALGLDINPASGRPRRAIEVYPHPATVALFGLGRTLKYKQRPGRSFDELHSALLTLIDHIQSLADAETPMVVTDLPAWRDLTAAVRDATRKSELRHAEDQVDAVLCAYVARFAAAHPDRTTTYGDLETGYIVTPTLPAGLEPSTRTDAVPDAVKQAVQAYAVGFEQLQGVTDRYVALVTELLDEAGINYLTVAGRTKSVASFAGKAARTVDGAPVYTDPLNEITDQVGVRVVTYVLEDVQAVVELLADQLNLLADRDMGLETARAGRFGYASRHVLVTLADAGPAVAELVGRTASVQIRTVLQHAWAEFEHDIRYKGTVPDADAPDLDRRFALAAGLIELADREFSAIQDRMQNGMSDAEHDEEAEDPRIGAQELAAFLAGRFPGAGWSRTDHYEWVSGLLLELGVTSLTELGDALRPVDSAAISTRMGYRYPPGAVRRLDDALLSIFGERYVGLHSNARRAAALRTRLEKLQPGRPVPASG
ncbi:MAG: DUF429 domain-containing protein [Georgenia sp.]